MSRRSTPEGLRPTRGGVRGQVQDRVGVAALGRAASCGGRPSSLALWQARCLRLITNVTSVRRHSTCRKVRVVVHPRLKAVRREVVQVRRHRSALSFRWRAAAFAWTRCWSSGRIAQPLPPCLLGRYHHDVARLVLTVVGADRAGLVAALAEVVSSHGGNWEDSQLAELAGTFAGVVVVSVPAGTVTSFTEALQQLDGLLTVTAHPGLEEPPVPADWRELSLSVLGDDRVGIVRDVSAALSRHGVSIEHMATETREAPMAGGRLFEAEVVARVPRSADLLALRADLERLAAEILVDIHVGDG